MVPAAMVARCTWAACYCGELSLMPSRSVNAMYPTVHRAHVLPPTAWLRVASAVEDEAYRACGAPLRNSSFFIITFCYYLDHKLVKTKTHKMKLVGFNAPLVLFSLY